MKSCLVPRALLLLIVITSVACGDTSTAPTPSGPSPFIAQMGGSWSGSMTLDSAITGMCVPEAFKSQTVAMAVAQSETDLTARVTAAASGLACNYTGKANMNTFVMDASACEAPLIVVQCTDGVTRDLRLVGSTISATLNGGIITGSAANTYNIFETGSDKGFGELVTRYSYTARRQ
jgi:hypothetical protein